MIADDDLLSPELALVSPELRARAIAGLPEVGLDDFFPPRYVAPLPQGKAGHEFWLVAWELARVGAVAFVATVLIVLSLTLAADALR